MPAVLEREQHITPAEAKHMYFIIDVAAKKTPIGAIHGALKIPRPQAIRLERS